jgi:hypothetical protein
VWRGRHDVVLQRSRGSSVAHFFELQAKDDITAVLMDGTGSEVEETVFQRNIDKMYGPLMDRAADVIRRSQAAVASTREANARFVATRSSATNEREQMLNDLQAKYDAWKELRTNLLEGEKVSSAAFPLFLCYAYLTPLPLFFPCHAHTVLRKSQGAPAQVPAQVPRLLRCATRREGRADEVCCGCADALQCRRPFVPSHSQPCTGTSRKRS